MIVDPDFLNEKTLNPNAHKADREYKSWDMAALA